MKGTEGAAERELGWWVGGAVTGMALLMHSPSVHWLDSGELVTAAWGLGVAHPPGEWVWALVGRLTASLPVADIAFRVGLGSALAAGLAAGLVAMLTARLGAGVRASSDRCAGGALAGLLAGGGALLMQAVRPEVYALQLLAGVAGLALASSGSAGALGLLIALGAGVHPLLMALAIPGLMLVARPRGRGWFAWVCGGALGAGLMLYLPLRAVAGPGLAWGLPDVWSRFLDVLLARVFTQNFSDPADASLTANLGHIGQVLGMHGAAWLLLPALFGWAGVARRQRWQTLGWWVAGGSALLSIVSQNKVDPHNPDLHGYLLLPLVLLQVGAGLALVRAPVGRRMRWMAGLSLGLAWLGASAVRWGVPDDWRPHAWVARQMDGLPAGATVLVRGNDPAFLGLYHREVEQRRPDLVWVARPLVGHANFDLELQRRFGPRPGGLDIGRIPSGLAEAWDQQRPLFLEVRAQDRPLGTRLGPWGLLFRAAPVGEQAALHPPALARHRHWLRLSLLDPPRSRHGSLVELLWREEAGAHWRELGAPPGLVRAVLPEAVDDTP